MITTHPTLAAEWHPTKNLPLTPNEVVAGTNKNLWWKCVEGHEWLAMGNSRVRGSGCPYCGNRRVSGSNAMATTHPSLALEWHPTKNLPLTPNDVVAGTNKTLWWQCVQGHEWQSRGYRRASGSGCPGCSGRVASSAKNLAATHPTLAAEWHPTKNLPLTPNEVLAGTQKGIWWQCAKGHEWKTKGADRVRGWGCPYCGNQRVSSFNSMITTHPTLAAEWHPTKNLRLTPNDVVAGTHKRIWWQCAEGHEWPAVGSSRIKGTGCPYCKNQRVTTSNSMITTHPTLAAEWHPTKNLPLTPNDVVAGTNKTLWWQCVRGHEWPAMGISRLNGSSCPNCDAMATTHPTLALEWHPTKNLPLTPNDVVAGTTRAIWWQCAKAHTWQAKGSNRVNGTGCPRCNTGWSVTTIRTFVESLLPHLSSFSPSELDTLFQQTGLLAYGGQGRAFVKALSTGHFPQDELTKFVAGEASLVERMLIDEDGAEVGSLIEWDRQADAAARALDKQPDVLAGVGLERSLPLVGTTQALAALNVAAAVVGSADAEAVEFLVASAVAKIWRHAFRGSEAGGAGDGAGAHEAVAEAQTHLTAPRGDDYGSVAASRFLKQYQQAQDLPIPAGYAFRAEEERLGRAAPITMPNLMQRLCASQALSRRRYGNWSGTGAGKTLAAILATRVANVGLTVVCCPNSVVEGWSEKITNAFPGSAVATKTWTPKWPAGATARYLVLNYEQFQQPDTPARLGSFLRRERVEFVVIDEIHQAKQRVVTDLSLRRRHVQLLVGEAAKQNADLYVLAMSATPVINNLQEGKSLIELVSGLEHHDLETTASVTNCMAIHRKFVTLGLRWLPEYDLEWDPHDPRVRVDCTAQIPAIRALRNGAGSPLAIETILTEARLPVIRKRLREWGAADPSGSPRTLLYTRYISGIEQLLREALVTDKWRVGSYTGEDKSGLRAFLDGRLDVLIATEAISTGVDHLQDNCHRMIINALPWTSAEFEQLKGRLFRQGQGAADKRVQLLIPLTYAELGGARWSYCDSRWERIAWKKSVADAAVDGVVPEEHWRTPAQAYKDAMAWLRRLDEGAVNVISREAIQTQLPAVAPTALRAPRRYSDFSEMNRHWNTTGSVKTHARLAADPAEWVEYHELYREARKNWPVVPFEEFINWARLREDRALVIADMGAGEAKVAEALAGMHTVYSVDHVAANGDVLAEDMAHTALDDESTDVVLFSLSLMGTNVGDYIREANRVLRLDGSLHIYEATSRFSDLPGFVKSLQTFGFKVFHPEDVSSRFTHIEAKKDRDPQPNANIRL